MPGMDKMKKLQGMMRGAGRAVVLPGETGMKAMKKGKKKVNRLKAAAKARAKMRGKTKTMMQRLREKKAPGY